MQKRRPKYPVSPLTTYRLQHGLNYEQAGEAAGISPSSWWRIEHLEVVARPATAKLLAELLGIPPIRFVRDVYRDEKVA